MIYTRLLADFSCIKISPLPSVPSSSPTSTLLLLLLVALEPIPSSSVVGCCCSNDGANAEEEEEEEEEENSLLCRLTDAAIADRSLSGSCPPPCCNEYWVENSVDAECDVLLLCCTFSSLFWADLSKR